MSETILCATPIRPGWTSGRRGVEKNRLHVTEIMLAVGTKIIKISLEQPSKPTVMETSSGHDVNFDSKGIHIDGKYTGVFASKTQATVVNGTGGFEGFQGVFNTNCRGTCAAGGILTALPGHSFDQLASSLRGPNEWGDKFSQHQGDQYRGGNREGVDIHLSYVKGDELQDVHFDWRFPFGSG